MQAMNSTPARIEDVGLTQLTRRIALVHDWLTAYVGGERVLEQMLQLFPGAHCT